MNAVTTIYPDLDFNAGFLSVQGMLRRYVQRCFPDLCTGSVDDVVASSFVVAMEHPERFATAWKVGGRARVAGLFRLIAWRAARGVCGRKYYRSEVANQALMDQIGVRPPGQELLAMVREQLDIVVDEAVETYGGNRPAQLREALCEKFATGDADTQVARRTGVRREHLNRAKRHVVTTLMAQTAAGSGRRPNRRSIAESGRSEDIS